MGFRPVERGVIIFLQESYNRRKSVPIREIDLMYQTMLAELGQRSLDGSLSPSSRWRVGSSPSP